MLTGELLAQVDEISGSLPEDYLCICLTNGRDFYIDVSSGGYTLETIAEGVNWYLLKLTKELLAYHELLEYYELNTESPSYYAGRAVERMFPREVVERAIKEIYEHYSEEREEITDGL